MVPSSGLCTKVLRSPGCSQRPVAGVVPTGPLSSEAGGLREVGYEAKSGPNAGASVSGLRCPQAEGEVGLYFRSASVGPQGGQGRVWNETRCSRGRPVHDPMVREGEGLDLGGSGVRSPGMARRMEVGFPWERGQVWTSASTRVKREPWGWRAHPE